MGTYFALWKVHGLHLPLPPSLQGSELMEPLPLSQVQKCLAFTCRKIVNIFLIEFETGNTI